MLPFNETELPSFCKELEKAQKIIPVSPINIQFPKTVVNARIKNPEGSNAEIQLQYLNLSVETVGFYCTNRTKVILTNKNLNGHLLFNVQELELNLDAVILYFLSYEEAIQKTYNNIPTLLTDVEGKCERMYVMYVIIDFVQTSILSREWEIEISFILFAKWKEFFNRRLFNSFYIKKNFKYQLHFRNIRCFYSLISFTFITFYVAENSFWKICPIWIPSLLITAIIKYNKFHVSNKTLISIVFKLKVQASIQEVLMKY